jgi:plastocyanin
MKPLLIVSVVGLLAVAGCGSSSSSSSTNSSTGTATGSGGAAAPSGGGGGGGGQQLALSADPQQLKFNTNKLSAKAGKVTITMTNPSGLQHDIAIKGGVDAKGPVVGQGGKSTVTVTLKPGKYTFYCSVDSHEAAGMNGELDVQ